MALIVQVRITPASMPDVVRLPMLQQKKNATRARPDDTRPPCR
jgi:hypothetical protein